MRLLLVASAWALAAAATLGAARWTGFGPIVVNLSHNHGVHLGELVVLLLAGAAAALVTTACLLSWWENRRVVGGARVR